MLSELDANEIHIYAKISQVFYHNSLCKGSSLEFFFFDFALSSFLNISVNSPSNSKIRNSLEICFS